MKEGETLRATGPYGDFYLKNSNRDILFIATGSGMAPVRSMLYQVVREQTPRKVQFFFGARTQKDLYYQEELLGWEKTLPDFKYVPTLSRPLAEEPWQGERGRVTGLIEKYIPEGANVDVYICGSPVMVDSCAEILKRKKIPGDRIFFDKFE
jgi:Na+-transporting NADH:ubiquinone oxidoreductase subunit F